MQQSIMQLTLQPSTDSEHGMWSHASVSPALSATATSCRLLRSSFSNARASLCTFHLLKPFTSGPHRRARYAGECGSLFCEKIANRTRYVRSQSARLEGTQHGKSSERKRRAWPPSLTGIPLPRQAESCAKDASLVCQSCEEIAAHGLAGMGFWSR